MNIARTGREVWVGWAARRKAVTQITMARPDLRLVATIHPTAALRALLRVVIIRMVGLPVLRLMAIRGIAGRLARLRTSKIPFE